MNRSWVTRIFIDFPRWLSIVLMMLMIVLLLVNTITRALFDYMIPYLFDYITYMFAGVIVYGMAPTIAEKGHITIDVLYKFFPRMTKKAVDFINYVLAFGFLVVMAYAFYLLIRDSYDFHIKSNDSLQLLMYIPQSLVGIGMIFALAGLIISFRKYME